MINKRRLHHSWKKLQPISHWYFLITAIFLAVVAIYALRQNNLTAIRLRDEVVAADKANKNVEEKLRKLRVFTYSHMNADLSSGSGVQHPIQLKYKYDRLVAAEKARLEQTNQSIYTQAQSVCEQRVPAGVSGSGRIACIEEYVTQNTNNEKPIEEDLYKFNFISPRWSPDLAGFSILFAGLFFILFVFRFAGERWLRYELHNHD